MTEEQDTPAPSAEPAAHAPTNDAPAADLDLDVLIAEYTAQAGSPERARPVVQPQPTPERDYGSELRNSMQSNRDLLEMRIWAEGIEEERIARREHEDREAAFAQAQKSLEGIDHLPEDYGRRWLIAQASLDPELHHDWHNRHESEDAMRRCQSTLRRTLNKLREEAKRMPDPEATADRAAVAASIMKDGRSSVAIEKPPPDLSRMSDQEFAKYKETIGL